MNTSRTLLEVQNLRKYFKIGGGFLGRPTSYLKAVDGVTFSINRGETMGLVGESGCGKSTTGRTIIRLYQATGGEVKFDGTDLTKITERDMLPYRKRIQMIFQDPYASLNGRMTVTDIIGEGITTHNIAIGNERQERILELLNHVGLKREHANRYPHEFSGGQRQRIGIARALAVEPDLVVCDEPISALDVSIQAQVVNLLEDFQDEMDLTYLFIAHDLSMVRHISDHIGVMYLGMLVETADSDELYKHPLHPYTKALLSAIPTPDPIQTRQNKRILLEGDMPSPIDPPEGCRFATRCPLVSKRCYQVTPQLIDRGSGHFVACHNL